MNEIMLQEIHDQPRILKIAIPDLRQQAALLQLPKDLHKVILTGSGDSYIAALACERLFRVHTNLEVRALPAIDASRYETYDRHSILAVISISGGVSRPIEAALRAKDQGAYVIAVSANPESQLAQSSSSKLIMPKPIARHTPHSRDYTLTLASLAVLLERIIEKDLKPLAAWPEAVDETIERSFTQVSMTIRRAKRTWFLGAGPDRATALYGALKYWEGGAMNAWSEDLEEFAHGAKEITHKGDAVVIVASGESVGRAIEMLPGMKQIGVKPWIITDSIPNHKPTYFEVPRFAGPEWMPFVSCIPIQVLTHYASVKRGVEAALPVSSDPHSMSLEAVHVEWTKGSKILDGGYDF